MRLFAQLQRLKELTQFAIFQILTVHCEPGVRSVRLWYGTSFCFEAMGVRIYYSCSATNCRSKVRSKNLQDSAAMFDRLDQSHEENPCDKY